MSEIEIVYMLDLLRPWLYGAAAVTGAGLCFAAGWWSCRGWYRVEIALGEWDARQRAAQSQARRQEHAAVMVASRALVPATIPQRPDGISGSDVPSRSAGLPELAYPVRRPAAVTHAPVRHRGRRPLALTAGRERAA